MATAVSFEPEHWDLIKSKLREHLAPEAFQNWVAPTRQESFQHGRLRVRVPDQLTKQLLEQEYRGHIERIARELGLEVAAVEFLTGELPTGSNESGLGGDAAVPVSAPEDELRFSPATTQLNPKFRFDNFVVGSCNQFAHAAAAAVASGPSRSYNPLFIYGGVGMGKTHLMHAVGRSLLETYPSMRVVYTSSERFMNEMIQCIRSNRMPVFQRHYRSADVLLVDDIQIIGGKERTQEEFFHTFNELFDHQKQIIISSDSPPKSISGLVDRLRSRFEWGLMVDVQPPDLETKMAILDKKAELEGVTLPDDVRTYIAAKTKSSIRELEGAFVKLVAFSSMARLPITLQMAQQTLKYLIAVPDRKVTMESIVRAVADRFGMQPGQLKQKSNARQISYPRQIAMYLIRELTHGSLPEIGKFFGQKHHTTVLHSVNKIERLRQSDAELNSMIQSISDSVQ